MFGIESRSTNNYPGKLHRLCIHMRERLTEYQRINGSNVAKRKDEREIINSQWNSGPSIKLKIEKKNPNFRKSRRLLKLANFREILFHLADSLSTTIVVLVVAIISVDFASARGNSWPLETNFKEETDSRNDGGTRGEGRRGRERKKRNGSEGERGEGGGLGRKKGNSGKGCTLQQRSISGFHFVLGVLRRLRATRLTHRRAHDVHTFIRNGHACTLPWHTPSYTFPLPFSSTLLPRLSPFLWAAALWLSPFLQPVLRVDLEGSSEGMLRRCAGATREILIKIREGSSPPSHTLVKPAPSEGTKEIFWRRGPPLLCDVFSSSRASTTLT